MENSSGKFKINFTDIYKTVRGFMVTLLKIPNRDINMENSSGKFKINFTDIYKTVRGFLVTLLAVAGTAVIAHIGAEYANWDYNVCFNTDSCWDVRGIAIPAIGALIEIARRFFSNYRNK